MVRRRFLALPTAFLVLALVAMLMGGCQADTTGTGTSDETSTLPEQNGLAVGDVAPDFRMQTQDQVTVALKDYLGTKNVILVFYPADFTPV